MKKTIKRRKDKMIIMEEYGKDMTIFGISEEAMTNFESWLTNTAYSGCTGISKYNVPKANKIVKVFITIFITRFS